MSKKVVEIVLQATDKASKVIANLGKSSGKASDKLEELNKTSGKAADNLENLDNSGKDASAGIGSLAEAATALAPALSVAAVITAAKAAWELGELGAEANRTARAFENISGGAYQANRNLEAMKRATRGAMSEQEAMASANQLMQMGLANTSDELESITRMAVKLGGAMGHDAGKSIEDFSAMLANTSIPRLDTFGISSGKVRTRILELQEATEGLTREQAFMIAVQEEGARAMQRLGADTEDEKLATERLDAAWSDLKVVAGQELAPAVGAVSGALADMIVYATEAQKKSRRLQDLFGEEAAQLNNWRAAGRAGHEAAAEQMAELERRERALMVSAEKAAFQEREAASATYDLAAAADAADDPMDSLGVATGKVAQSLGELEFDNQMFWELALASGASLEQLGPLAEQLGIASSAEIEATKRAYELAESFGEGELSAQQYREEMEKTRRKMQEMDHIAGLLAGKMAAAMGAGVRGPHTGASATRRQHGGPASGLTLVGEGGPEALYMPPGSYVHSNQSPLTQQVMNDNRQYHRTNHIGTELALALEENRAQQEQTARANALM